MQQAQSPFICPQTRQALREATSEELAALRKMPAHAKLEAAWIRTDSAMAYPVQNGIPQLIPSAGIPLDQGASPTFLSTP
ncbi:MAG: hypothetical protein CAK90_06955 [Spartobacteria bacterium AMD-G4]|jgi:uncharacterized protein YbaR (Trm112 family)|nr:MAG: hypothetical protein CAK90_06955 [Spartobacteria bacterium AMD-G4]